MCFAYGGFIAKPHSIQLFQQVMPRCLNHGMSTMDNPVVRVISEAKPESM